MKDGINKSVCFKNKNKISGYRCTRGPLHMRFFETLENNGVSRKPFKRRSDLVLNGQMRVPK